MTEKDLVDFYNYMKSKERAKTILPDCPQKNVVYHSDLENFKVLKENSNE
jgi:hypothetical protein